MSHVLRTPVPPAGTGHRSVHPTGRTCGVTAFALAAAVAVAGPAFLPAAAAPLPLPPAVAGAAAAAPAEPSLLELAQELGVPYSAVGTDAAKGRAGDGGSAATTPSLAAMRTALEALPNRDEILVDQILRNVAAGTL